MCVHHHGEKRMIWYQMVAYQMCERPEKLPEGTEELWDIFARESLSFSKSNKNLPSELVTNFKLNCNSVLFIIMIHL